MHSVPLIFLEGAGEERVDVQFGIDWIEVKAVIFKCFPPMETSFQMMS